MIYGSWKMKISKKKEKKHLKISSFYTSVSKIIIIGYTVPEIWHVMDVIVTFHFGLFFALYPPPPPHPLASPNSSKNESFIKMKKPPESIYTSAPKLIIICYTVPEISAFEIKVLSMLAIKCWGKFRIFQFALAMRHQKKEPKTYQKPLYITSTMASPYLSISPRTMIWFNTWYYLFYLYHIVYL